MAHARTRSSRVILAGTGHRPEKLGDDAYEPRSPIQDWIRREVRKVFKRVRPSAVISGMALGFDTWLALEAIDANIPLWAYVPFEGQESRWWGESRAQYYELLKRAKKVRTICAPGYEPWKMQKRNEAMMDDCDVALSLFDGSPGGTFNCVSYADSIHRERINIDPTLGIEFIRRKEHEFHGRFYHYCGNLRWKAVPVTKTKVKYVPPGDDGIPF